MRELLNLVAAQSTATIGSLARAWLWVMAALWPVISVLTYAVGMHPFKGQALASGLIGLYAATFTSLPIMAVLMLIHIARKW